MTLVFVYGTLKSGGSNHDFLTGQTFLGASRTLPGFTLVSLGDYPGMIPSPADREGVTGEVWAVNDTCLRELDRLEGVTEKLYRRAPVPLAAPFEQTTVETYFYLRNVKGHPRLGATWPVSYQSP
jgi:gamma-glutamylaminecyclotransferase